MSPRSSPLLGYNNNVRHKGKVFHIQTEDSGVKYGHITTHLFMDGGRILKSVKTGYAEYIGNERMGDIVREMMKQQHKAMFIALREGKFDAPSDPPAARPALRPGPATPVPPEISSGHLEEAPTDPRGPRSTTPLPVEVEPAFTPGSPAVPADAVLIVAKPVELAIGVVLDEHEGHAAPPGPDLTRDLPPAPASLLRDKTISAPPPSGSGSMPGSRTPTPTDGISGERRYAPTRPASIFGQARPQQGKSIFGEDLNSDKSLDEVILSYLAEDVEGEKK
jgi:hypothetical protein